MMPQELEELKGLLAGMSTGTLTIGRASDRKSPSPPSMATVSVHTIDSDTLKASVSVEGGTSTTHQPMEVESASPIAKRVRNDPSTQHPLMLQTSPYMNPVTHVYKTRKRRRCPVRELAEDLRALKVEGDQGGQPLAKGSGTPLLAGGTDAIMQSQIPQPCGTHPEPGPSIGDVCNAPTEVYKCVKKSDMA